MNPVSHCPERDRLRALLDGALPESEQKELSAHLETCAACQRAIEGLAAGRDTWMGTAEQLAQGAAPAGPALAQAMHRACDVRASSDSVRGPEAQAELPENFLDPPEKPGHLGKLAHYEVLDVIGSGAMGIVLRAFDQKLHRMVAIKVMSPQLASSAGARRRFIREGQAAAAVCHEHVVTIHAVDEARGLPYLVMQYVGGASLQDRLDRDGPLTVREILRIGMQAAYGLAAAHAQGLVHRDIKPSNILLENGIERVKITDFGLARAVDDASLTQTGVIAGTPQYMAPEQAHGEPLDHRADLFSLGSVLYALCAGRPPFRASSMIAVLKRVCEETPRPVREINPDVPDWLAGTVGRLHAKTPADRFQSAHELAEHLELCLAHLQRPDQIAAPRLVQAPAGSERRPASAHMPLAEATPGAAATSDSFDFRIRSKYVAASFAVCLAVLAALSRVLSPSIALVINAMAGLALLLALVLALLQRTLTGTWRHSIVGLVEFPERAWTSRGSPQVAFDFRRTITLLLFLIGAAICFGVLLPLPAQSPAGEAIKYAGGAQAGIGWLLLGLACVLSARMPIAAADTNASSSSSTNPPLRPAVGFPEYAKPVRRLSLAVSIAVCLAMLFVLYAVLDMARMTNVTWREFQRGSNLPAAPAPQLQSWAAGDTSQPPTEGGIDLQAIRDALTAEALLQPFTGEGGFTAQALAMEGGFTPDALEGLRLAGLSKWSPASDQEFDERLFGLWKIDSQESGGAAAEAGRMQFLKFGEIDSFAQVPMTPEERREAASRRKVSQFVAEMPDADDSDARLTDCQTGGPVGGVGRMIRLVDVNGGLLRYGIYELEGGTLKLCLAPASEPLPQEFRTDAGSRAVLYVCRRPYPVPAELQGRWRVVPEKPAEGEAAEPANLVWTIVGDRALEDDGEPTMWRLEVKPGEDPPQIEFHRRGEHVLSGIYKIEDDRLTVFMNAAGHGPKSFDIHKNQGYIRKFQRDASFGPKGLASTTSVSGVWESDLGLVALMHAPTRPNTPIYLQGVLIWKTQQTRLRCTGTFDPVAELVILRFVDDVSGLTRTARLKLSIDGAKLVGQLKLTTGEASSVHPWVLMRRSEAAPAGKPESPRRSQS